MADITNIRICDGVDWGETVQAVGSFLFGAVGFTLLFAILLLFGSVITEYIGSETEALLLIFTGFLILTVAFCYCSNVKSSIFPVFAIIGGLVASTPLVIFYGASPVFSILFFTFSGIIVIGTVIRIGLSRSGLSL